MNTLIKIDLRDLYAETILINCRIFNVTPIFNDDGTYTIKEWNVTGDILTIMHWFYVKTLEKSKKIEDDLRRKLREGDLEYVERRLELWK